MEVISRHPLQGLSGAASALGDFMQEGRSMDRTRRWTRAALALAGVLALAGCGGASPGGSSAGTTTVKIGLSSGFSGAEAFLGQDAQKGAQMAIDELRPSDPKVRYSLVT